jgi:hypothetical protein
MSAGLAGAAGLAFFLFAALSFSWRPSFYLLSV